MSIETAYDVIPDLAVLGSTRRPGRAIVPFVRFVVAHDTGNPGASARAHARWYRNDPNPPPDAVSSAHLFVDDKEIIECIPALTGAPEQALHVLNRLPKDNELYGYDANRAAIGVEYCYGGTIDAGAAYERYVWVLAKLCHTFTLDPAHDVVGHQVLDPERRSDPGQGLQASGRTYAGLLRDVVACFNRFPANGVAAGSRALQPRQPARATAYLHIRPDPTTQQMPIGMMKPGDPVDMVQMVSGEAVFGIDQWCQLTQGGFCWSGAVRPG